MANASTSSHIMERRPATEAVDPFIPTADELQPNTRLLRVLKSGERVPVTLRLAPLSTPADPPSPSASTEASAKLWGIEYDDASRGKHEGVYEGRKLFQPRQKGKGAGSFLVSPKDLRRGYTFAEALAERYGVEIPGVGRIIRSHAEENEIEELEKKGVALGSSGIVVKAPGIEEVQRRIGRLGRLQSVGLEGYHVCRMGGNEETKAFLKANLTSLTSLDLSGNLLTFWSDVAEIVECIPSVRCVVLNKSRIEALSRNSEDPPVVERVRQSFQQLREVELCDSCMTWADITAIAPFLPALERLDLIDNVQLAQFGPIDDTSLFPVLRYLNLSGCGLTDWTGLMRSVHEVKALETLNISSTPLDEIPPRPPSSWPIPVPNLILLDSSITAWSSIDALYQWTGDHLSSLKFSISSLVSGVDPSRISGNESADRPILIAKLPHLRMLNATITQPTERRDAEVAYVRKVDRLIAEGKTDKKDWGRYEVLKRTHGVTSVSGPVVNLKQNHLRARLYDLSVWNSKGDVGYDNAANVSVLPSAPVALLRKKVQRALKLSAGQEVRIWTVYDKFLEDRTKAVEVPDGENVGWWFGDGDEIIVETP